MARTYTSGDIMSGLPAVVDYAEYLAEVYPLILSEATSAAAAQLQQVATARARVTPRWTAIARHVEVFPIDDAIAVGTRDPAYAQVMRTLEYGDADNPASPVLTVTMTSTLQPMRQTMQSVIDGWL